MGQYMVKQYYCLFDHEFVKMHCGMVRRTAQLVASVTNPELSAVAYCLIGIWRVDMDQYEFFFFS